MTTFFTSPLCLDHEVRRGHPERPERLGYLLQYLDEHGVLEGVRCMEGAPAANDVLTRLHTKQLVAALENAVPEAGIASLSSDMHISPGSLDAAKACVGAVLAALDAVLEGDDARAFCAVRPPGHHAEEGTAMGFCFFNSVAIGADAALRSPDIQRVAILDFDVHHGNGTVDLFKDRGDVLVCSSFQHPHYPHRLYDVRRDHLVHTPLEAGTDGAAFRRAIERDWLPALRRHEPDIIFVSAGFDAHEADPLGDLLLTEDDFAWVTTLIGEAADTHAQGRIVSVLEGGYDLGALARSVCAHFEAL